MLTRRITILSIALGLCGCASTQLPPIDDAYYWPEKNTPIIQNTQSNHQSPITNHQSPITNHQSPTLEYLSVQDTTVTVRIHR